MAEEAKIHLPYDAISMAKRLDTRNANCTFGTIKKLATVVSVELTRFPTTNAQTDRIKYARTINANEPTREVPVSKKVKRLYCIFFRASDLPIEAKPEIRKLNATAAMMYMSNGE
jgi:hypothetical protein